MLARHFYLPAMAGLRDRYTVGRELSADHAAVNAHGIAPLAGALLKVTGAPAGAAASPSAAMSNDALLKARIRRLETGTEPAPPQHRPDGCPVHDRRRLLLAFAVAWSASRSESKTFLRTDACSARGRQPSATAGQPASW